MCEPEDYAVLRWPDEQLKSASGGWRAARAFRLMNRLVAQRGTIPAELWGADPRRWQVARRVSAIIRDDIGWTSDSFIPDDPLDVLLWGGWYDLAEVEALMEVEEQFVVDISDCDAEKIWNEGLTLGQFVDILLEKSPCPVSWPLWGNESLESCTCSRRAAFDDLKGFIQSHCHVQATRIRPSTDLRAIVPRSDWLRLNRFLQARFSTRGLIRKRFLGGVSPGWTWSVLSTLGIIAIGEVLRWQAIAWLSASIVCMLVFAMIVTRLSWLTWRRGVATARNVVDWVLEERYANR